MVHVVNSNITSCIKIVVNIPVSVVGGNNKKKRGGKKRRKKIKKGKKKI